MEKEKNENNNDKKLSKNNIFIIGIILFILLIVIIISILFKSSVVGIKKVKMALSNKFYSISCIDSNCNYLEANEGDKLGKTTTYIVNSDGKKIAKFSEKYNGKAKTDRVINEVTDSYIIFNEINRSDYSVDNYSIAKKNGKTVYSTKYEIRKINDNLIKEKNKEGTLYKILTYKGKELFTNVEEIDTYNDSNLISIEIKDNYIILDKNGENILEGYSVEREVTDEEGKTLYIILKDKNGNSFYYYSIDKNEIIGDGFQNYSVKSDSENNEYIIEKNENNNVVKYILKTNGKQVKYDSLSEDEFIINIKKNLDENTYSLLSASIVNTNQKNVLVNNKKENSLGVYNINDKKYTLLFNFKGNSSYNYATIYKLQNDKNKAYVQITCDNSNCDKSLLYVYDLDKAKVLYKLENDDLVANKYTQYSDDYKVVKYNYSSKNVDYKGKYVLYDKDNKELIKSTNSILVIDKEYEFGSISTDRYVTLYSVKDKRQLNNDDSSATVVNIGKETVYKYSDKNNTYILSDKGKELVKISNDIKLVYSSDTISYIDKDKIYILNVENASTKKYKLKENEKINDASGDTIPPYKNSIIVNNSMDKYIKVINYKGSVVKKITKQEVYKVKQSENSNVLIFTKKTVKNKIYYGLYIAK